MAGCFTVFGLRYYLRKKKCQCTKDKACSTPVDFNLQLNQNLKLNKFQFSITNINTVKLNTLSNYCLLILNKINTV